MIGHQAYTRRENYDLPLWRASAIKKKPPFFNVRALVTYEIKLCAERMRNAILRNNLKLCKTFYFHKLIIIQ